MKKLLIETFMFNEKMFITVVMLGLVKSSLTTTSCKLHPLKTKLYSNIFFFCSIMELDSIEINFNYEINK